MRYLHALIVSTGLCVVPSLGLAATGADAASVSAVSASKPAGASERTSAETKATADSRAADVADDKTRYAERETKSGEAQEYRGGDTIVIGASAATAILAVLLLIVLI
jgi:septum formation inhibitor MinC